MTYMAQDDFTRTGGIHELSFDEIELVDGAIAPVVLFGAGLVVGFGIAAAAELKWGL